MTSLDRYHRQMLLPGIGREGQLALQSSHALLVGCGALGSAIADTLIRAGLGTLTLVDRDLVECTNLQRQTLYCESDVNTPKAFAAQSRLSTINSSARIVALTEDFNPSNAQQILDNKFVPQHEPAPPPVSLILDGLDNFPTRYLLNDLAVSRALPYIYGGAVATTGLSFTVLPKKSPDADSTRQRSLYSADQSTPCLRCVFPEAPPPGISPTCDTAGVLGPIVSIIAAHQAAQAIKLLTNNAAQLDRSLLSFDLWSNDLHRFDLSPTANSDCPCCGKHDFEYLNSSAHADAASLCGRDAVQIMPPSSNSDFAQSRLDLNQFAARLAP
ncbi:MAG TPA: ThiF family adenylyltransferase, partial [Phycisphaerales bacterium]|nr:ThiF family adenylyltransferase [Phycisphaerales bacterium]